MSKKLFIIIVSVVLLFFLISLIGYYFILQSNNGTPGGTNSVFKNFFPFGGSTTTTPVVSTQPTTNQNPTPTTSNYGQKLRKISTDPVAGAGVLDVKAGTVVRHIEKATGHIFETELFSPNQTRISNTTIPMVYDAIWGNKNGSLIARYLKDDNQTVDTYGLLIKETSIATTPQSLTGVGGGATGTGLESTVSAVKFPANISDISVFGSSVFSLEQSANASFGYISNFDGTKKTQIWNSPIKELLSQYVNAKTIALTTKPDQNTPGFLYFVDTGNGQVKRIIGNVFGLSDLVDDLASQVLYLDQGNNPQLFIFNVKNKTYTTATPTTFPEKCVWSKKDRNVFYCAVPQGVLSRDSLTSWYQGLISFTDDIWKYNIKNGTANIIENLYGDSNEQIDVIKPILSDSEQYLVFINKIDNSLWSLDLTK